MRIQRATPVNEFLAKLIFLVLPTAVISYYLLYRINIRFVILMNEAWLHSLYMAAGMGIAALLYSFRFRLLPTFIPLIIGLYSIYKGIDYYANGEFDAFFIARRFQAFAILFCAGWFIGWGYIRVRYFAVMISMAFLAGCIALVATAKVETVNDLLMSFLPAILYVLYNIFTAEQIYNYKDKSKKFWWFLTGRLALFGVLAAIILFSVVRLMYGSIKETVDNYGGGGKAGGKSMLKQNKDGTFDIEQYHKLDNQLNRDKQLLFCAHINNYFPGTDIPNPLYLTAFYYTKFDTETETFERDKVIPSNDLFEPDPSKIPLFATKMDTMVIHNSLGTKGREVVEAEIYNCNLSPSTYLAPNVGYFVQPITVEKDYREKFRSAYRVKSYVSKLNSAYFVYNSDTDFIRKFQEERFKVLREVKDYNKVDSTFFRYYTIMPKGEKYKVIVDLAHQVTDTAKTPVDKVIAIRNYFLSKNENGEHLYKYTDNPGVPDLPNASKLLYFLTENHKGYCAYYAGATLFMLRALGIPSRIAVGFMTEDRSDKNKGWYWYYANQAHAWIQVYFPGYGWLDFDTTVGNTDEARPTPQPDGTPPMQPPKAWLALDGVVENTDTVNKRMKFRVKSYVYHDKTYELKDPLAVDLDMKIAVVFKDSLSMPLARVQKGETGAAVSYAESLSKMEALANESGEALIKRLPAFIPTDELYLRSKEAEKKKQEQDKQKNTEQKSNKNLIWLAIGIVGGFIIILLLLPEFLLWYYLNRYKNAKPDADKPYWAYRTAMYYLHMIGYGIGSRTPMQFANQVIDPDFGTSFAAFMIVYLKKKYAKQDLNEREMKQVGEFLKPFLATIRSKTAFKDRLTGFANPVRMASFFMMPEEEGSA